MTDFLSGINNIFSAGASHCDLRTAVVSIRAAAIFILTVAAVPAADEKEIQRFPAVEEVIVYGDSWDAMELYVRILDENGDTVEGLGKDDFTLTEDGKPQNITSAEEIIRSRKSSEEVEPVNILFLLETSNWTSTKYESALKSFRRVFSLLHKGDRAALAVFHCLYYMKEDFTGDHEKLIAHLEETGGAGRGVQLYEAVRRGIKEFDGVKGRKIMIILSQGIDSSDACHKMLRKVNPFYTLSLCQQKNISVYSILFKNIVMDVIHDAYDSEKSAGAEEFKRLAVSNGGLNFTINDLEDLNEVLPEIGGLIDHYYRIEYTTSNKNTDLKYRFVRVKVEDHPEYRVRTRVFVSIPRFPKGELKKMLRSDNPEYRRKAIEIIERLPHKKGVKLLKNFLEHEPEEALRKRAEEALHTIRDE